MSNFIVAFEQGQTGVNKGIPYGEGLESITNHTNGIHKKRIIAFAGAEKSGKSTLVDYAMVISVYLYSIANNLKVSWVYYTYEIDRVSKEFDFATFFLNYDFGIEIIQLPEGVLKEGKDHILLSPSYLKGEVMDDEGNLIKVDPEIFDKLKEVYIQRIVPLFGFWSPEGELLEPGLITVREQADNPTGIYKDLLDQANARGKVLRDGNKRPVKYVADDPNELRIVIIDHIRKLVPERGYKMKETIDKMSEYLVALRNLLGYTFVPIIHTNRGLASMDKISTFKGNLYPTSDDVKDSGNIGEDCNFLFTIMNPNDDKYNITKHFNVDIRDSKNNILYPNFKTIHLVSSRHCEFPRHFSVNMKGNIKKFEKFEI